jgi:hypothetical protein
MENEDRRWGLGNAFNHLTSKPHMAFTQKKLLNMSG